MEVGLRDHAGITWEEAATPMTIWGGVLASILTVAPLAGGGVVLVARLETALNMTLAIPLVLFVDLEVQRGGVVEHNIYIKVELIG